MNFGDKIKSGFQRWWEGGREAMPNRAWNKTMPRYFVMKAQATDGSDAENRVADLSLYSFNQLLQGSLTLKSSLSIVEICAGYWSRAFEGSKVFVNGKPVREYTTRGEAFAIMGTPDVGITPQALALMGRQMMTFGESVFMIVENDFISPKVMLLPAISAIVSGGAVPYSWRYDLHINAPDGQDQFGNAQSRKVPYEGVAADNVIHTTYAAYPESPWIGISPLALSQTTYNTIRKIDDMFLSETTLPSGMIMPVEQRSGMLNAGGAVTEFTDEVSDLLTQQSGSIVVLERPSQLPEAMDKPLPQGLLSQIRYGFTADGANVAFREQLERNIAEACGLPASIVATDMGSRAVRDGMRQFIDMTIAPKLNSVSCELSHKLGMNIAIYPDKSFDLGTTARGIGTLTRSMGNDVDGNPLPGVLSPQDAASMAGLPPEIFSD